MTLANMRANTLDGFTDIPIHTYTKRPLILLFGIFVVDAKMHAEEKLCLNTERFQVRRLKMRERLEFTSSALCIICLKIHKLKLNSTYRQCSLGKCLGSLSNAEQVRSFWSA